MEYHGLCLIGRKEGQLVSKTDGIPGLCLIGRKEGQLVSKTNGIPGLCLIGRKEGQLVSKTNGIPGLCHEEMNTTGIPPIPHLHIFFLAFTVFVLK